MHKAPDGTLIVSATDLVGYLACDHLSTLELGRAEERWERPHRREDLTVRLMQDRGDAHEAAHLEGLRTAGRSIIEIDKTALSTPDQLREAEAATLSAMRAGADVIFQATFFDGRWRGHADFLYRTDRPSPVLGAYSYDIADTKLSRGVKAAAIIQMCVYADLLERLQGVKPETVYVVTGDGVEHPHRLEDYAAYYRHAKARFEARVLGGSRAIATYPDPVDHCRVCVWYPTCIQRRRDDDHPSIVAGMRRVDTERFLEGGVPTLTAIAELPTDARRYRHQSARSCDGSATRRVSSSMNVGRMSGSSSSSRRSRRSRAAAWRPSQSQRHGTSSSTSRPIRGRSTAASNISSAWRSKWTTSRHTSRSGGTTVRRRSRRSRP